MLRTTPADHSLSLANNGINDIDAAFYAWAVTTLNGRTDLNKASEEFAVIASCYNDNARFFHRGLGHSRSLFPATAQTVYKEILALQKTGNFSPASPAVLIA